MQPSLHDSVIFVTWEQGLRIFTLLAPSAAGRHFEGDTETFCVRFVTIKMLLELVVHKMWLNCYEEASINGLKLCKVQAWKRDWDVEKITWAPGARDVTTAGSSIKP